MIVIFGATGNTGPHLVQMLTQRGQKVRAVVRDEARARELLGPEVELRRADLAQPDTVRAALDGAQKVYSAIGGPRGSERLVELVCGLVDAARAAGVEHFVEVSGIDARPDSPSRIQRWHGAIAEHLIASRLPHTILEPAFFFQNFLGMAAPIQAGVLPLPTGAARAGLIDARDVADVAATVLTEAGHLGQRYVLTGPESLSHAEVAAIFTQVLDRPIQFVDVPGDAFCKAGIDGGLAPWFAELLTDVYVTVFAQGLIQRTTDVVPRVTGHGARSLAAFVREQRAAFLPL